MCGTIKSDVIEDDDNLPKILDCSIYYIKPEHILSTVTKNITYTAK